MAKYIKKVMGSNGKWRYIYDMSELKAKSKNSGTRSTFTSSSGEHINSQGHEIVHKRKKLTLGNSKGVKRRGKGLGTGPVGQSQNISGGTHNAFNSAAYQQRKANAKKVTLLTTLHKLDKAQKKAEAEAKAKAARPTSQKIKDAAKNAYNKSGIKQRKQLKETKVNAAYDEKRRNSGEYKVHDQVATLNKKGYIQSRKGKDGKTYMKTHMLDTKEADQRKIAYQQKQYDKTFLGKTEKKLSKGSAKVKKKLSNTSARIRKRIK